MYLLVFFEHSMASKKRLCILLIFEHKLGVVRFELVESVKEAPQPARRVAERIPQQRHHERRACSRLSSLLVSDCSLRMRMLL